MQLKLQNIILLKNKGTRNQLRFGYNRQITQTTLINQHYYIGVK